MKVQKTVNFLTILLISLMPSCAKQKNQHKAALQTKAASSFSAIETNVDIAALQPEYDTQIQAKFSEIPFMVGSTIMKEELTVTQQLILTGICLYDSFALADYYVIEMQRSGWQKISEFHASEVTLLFQKPKKVCVISIRSLSNKYKIPYKSLFYICIGNKEK